jgi:hypothetical protein
VGFGGIIPALGGIPERNGGISIHKGATPPIVHFPASKRLLYIPNLVKIMYP